MRPLKLMLRAYGVDDDSPEKKAYDSLTGMAFYNIRPEALKPRGSVAYNPGASLGEDGQGVASMMQRLRTEDSGAFERIEEYLQLIVPGVERIRVVAPFGKDPDRPAPGENIGLVFDQKRAGQEHAFTADLMSDGTLRSLGILAALMQATAEAGPRPSLVAIEEPECHVHPAALAVLRGAIDEASYSAQVIVATQSADLLDDQEVDPDSILVVESIDGETHIGPMSGAERTVIRERLFTPGELHRIDQIRREERAGLSGEDARSVLPDSATAL